MDTLTAFSIIALSACIQASFQLAISVVTLLSSHTRGTQLSSRRITRLVGAFLAGTVVMTTLIVATFAYMASQYFRHSTPLTVWSVVAGLLVGVGVGVWVFYYRRGDGTSLWIPRSLGRFLRERVKATSLGAEAFNLGLSSVVAEIVFIASPAAATALTLIALPRNLQLVGLGVYVVVASSSILAVSILISSGHALSSIQRWRTTNKRFLQFAAGSGLIVLGFYLYVNEVVATTAALGVR